MSIVISFNPVNYDNTKRKEAQETAIKVLSLAPKFVFPIAFGFEDEEPLEFVKNLSITTLNILRRSSLKTIEGTQKLPYIKDILDLCSRVECNVFGYINSDILVDNSVYNILADSKKDAFIFPRSDIVNVSTSDFINKKLRAIPGGDKHIGVDGFFFDRQWWIKNRNSFPDDLLIGATEWDTVYRFIIKKLTNNYIESRLLYHVYHNQTWTTTSPCALNNIKIWNIVKKE